MDRKNGRPTVIRSAFSLALLRIGNAVTTFLARYPP